MKKSTFLTLTLAAMLTMACKPKTGNTTSALPADSTAVDSADTADSIHTEAYIGQRLEHIYHTIYKAYAKNMAGEKLQTATEQFTSAAYNNLVREAIRLTPDEDALAIPGADYDHWVMGQDIAPDISMKVDRVSDITATTATADITIQNYSPQQSRLLLVLENGEWVIDSFVHTYEVEGVSEVYDEKEELETYVEGLKQ